MARSFLLIVAGVRGIPFREIVPFKPKIASSSASLENPRNP
jgi:hypothetical protein